MLEVFDRNILRAILGAHSKVPSDILYLETGAIPITHVISVKRLVYLQNILQKHDDSIVKKVYLAQKTNPSNGDWTKLIECDKEKYNLNISDDIIEGMTDSDYKSLVI